MKILNLIENYLDKQKDHKRRSHYASDLNKCTKQLYAKWLDIPSSDPPSFANKVKMKCGLIIEKDLFYESLKEAKKNKLIKNYKKQVRKEIRIKGLKYPIVLKPDSIITLNDKTKIIGECKSGFGQNIVQLKKDGKPKEDILVQTAMYTEYFNMPCYIPYIARDSGYITEFVMKKIGNEFFIENGLLNIKYDLDINKIIEKLIYLEKCIETKKPPMREHAIAIKGKEIKEEYTEKGINYKSDWQCLYCGYISRCWIDVIESCGIKDCYLGATKIN